MEQGSEFILAATFIGFGQGGKEDPLCVMGPHFNGHILKAEASGGVWPVLHLQVVRQIVSAFARCKVASLRIPHPTYSIPRRCRNTCRPGVTLFVWHALCPFIAIAEALAGWTPLFAQCP